MPHKKSVIRSLDSGFRFDTSSNLHQKDMREVLIDRQIDAFSALKQDHGIEPAVVTSMHKTPYNAGVFDGSSDSKVFCT